MTKSNTNLNPDTVFSEAGCGVSHGQSADKRLVLSLPDWPDKYHHISVSPDKINIGVLTGEGIGPEIISASLRVLSAIEHCTSLKFDIRYGGLIGKTAKEAFGKSLSREVIAWTESLFNEGGTILCGPASSRFVYEMRSEFDLFCKFTPVHPQAALRDAGVLKSTALENVDLVLVRENAGGDYFGESIRETDKRGRSRVKHSFSYYADEVHRIVDVAIRLARQRRGRLCLVIKSDGIPGISKLWADIFTEQVLGKELDISILEIDNAVYQIIAAAEKFDVIVSPNMFGDILADNASLLLGTRGLSYSGNFGASGFATYQTGHGAAYDIAGRNIANPIGQILSMAMMFRESFGLHNIATTIEESVSEVLSSGIRTQDIAAPGATIVGTDEMGERIAAAVEARLLIQQTPAQINEHLRQKVR
jgi:3-isopropylmalate dehydrogenase